MGLRLSALTTAVLSAAALVVVVAAPGRGAAGGGHTVRVEPADGPADLHPGTTTGDLYFRLRPGGADHVVFTRLVPGLVTSDRPEACPASVITVRPARGLAISPDPRDPDKVFRAEDVVSMAADAPPGCRGASFNIRVDLSDQP